MMDPIVGLFTFSLVHGLPALLGSSPVGTAAEGSAGSVSSDENDDTSECSTSKRGDELPDAPAFAKVPMSWLPEKPKPKEFHATCTKVPMSWLPEKPKPDKAAFANVPVSWFRENPKVKESQQAFAKVPMSWLPESPKPKESQ